MNTEFKQLENFTGIHTNMDASQVPWGGAISCKNMAQFIEGKLQRIPGIDQLSTVAVDGSVQIPLLTYAKELGGTGTASRTIGVYLGAGNVAKIVNLSTSAAMTGPALTSVFGKNWSYTFYAQQHLIAGAGNAIQKLTNDTTYAALATTGSLTANPEMIISFQDRLYVVDNTNAEGLVQYSDNLTNNFQALNIVNTKEVPGPITAMGIYVPSTGTMGQATRSRLLIFKRNAIWFWDESSKDMVSGKIGTLSPRTVTNSPAGVLFLGKRGNLNSVYLIPPGLGGFGIFHYGEPIDVGKPLFNLLNGLSGMTSGQEINAHAIVDGRFYKLWVSLNADTTNATEFWLDLDLLTQNPGETSGGKEPLAVWYGPHQRGAVDASSTSETRLELSRRAASGVVSWFGEKTDISTNFIDMDGNTMLVIVDLAMNAEPLDVEKIYDITQLHLASESNVIGNQVQAQTIVDSVVDSPLIWPIYSPNEPGIVHVNVAFSDGGSTGEAGHHAHTIFTHSLNAPFSIIGVTLQYLVYQNKGRVLSSTRGVNPLGVNRGG